MSRSIVLFVLLLPLLSQVPAGPSTDVQTLVGIMRPVKQLPSPPRSSTEITFAEHQVAS